MGVGRSRVRWEMWPLGSLSWVKDKEAAELPAGALRGNVLMYGAGRSQWQWAEE